jgi:hypothetical protein
MPSDVSQWLYCVPPGFDNATARDFRLRPAIGMFPRPPDDFHVLVVAKTLRNGPDCFRFKPLI